MGGGTVNNGVLLPKLGFPLVHYKPVMEQLPHISHPILVTYKNTQPVCELNKLFISRTLLVHMQYIFIQLLLYYGLLQIFPLW